jgi:hypothetical protein
MNALIVSNGVLGILLGVAIVCVVGLVHALKRATVNANLYLQYAALRQKERDEYATALDQMRGKLN